MITTTRFTPTKITQFIETFKSMLGDDPEQDVGDPNICLQNLITNIQNAINKVFPLIKPSNKKKRKFRNAWITPGIIKSMDHRDKLFENWLKNKTPENRLAYNIKRNSVTRIIEAAKEHTKYTDLLKAGSDVRKVYKCLNKTLKKSTKSGNNLPEEIKLTNSQIIQDPKDIANHLKKNILLHKVLNLLLSFPHQINAY